MSAERLPLGKECTKCGEWKLLDEFHRDSRLSDGRNTCCKLCRCKYNKRYYVENKEALLESSKRYYTENKELALERKLRYRAENKEALRQRAKRYCAENKEVINERSRRSYAENGEATRLRAKRYRAENKEALREYHKRYSMENKEYRREIQYRYRARKLSASGNFTAQQFLELCEAYGNVCLCCGDSEQLTVDHVIPLSKGGSNDISNIQPLCQSCNSSKGTKTTDYRSLFDKDIEELGETG